MLINKIQPVELRDFTDLEPKNSVEEIMKEIESKSPLETLIVSLELFEYKEYLNIMVEVIEGAMNEFKLNPSLTNAYIYSLYFKKKFIGFNKYAAACHEKGIVGFKEAYKWLEANADNKSFQDFINALESFHNKG